ncbi:uncharacterized protein LOC142977713 [Anticarsia gemmatalis]|uniref:uncharacterized protein LOC142977713 n=1 Tax=Anticarsia gemmatalis TaxID=129554 RepID=UPI003F764C84
MGGCRCSYKTCTTRTDGVTHMFHYPVFDKVRCHQWLTNAQKLEFLNLKVSQLKNRVICQHHFRDDNFMNFLKDKLTFDAVPTLDGPYCDTSQWTTNESVQDETKLYSISLDDIENEYLTFNDKKANFSVKYGDFLTNCDLMDLDSMNITNNNEGTQVTTNSSLLQQQSDKTVYDDVNKRKNGKSHVVNKNVHTNKKKQIVEDENDRVYTINLAELPVEVEGVQTTLTITDEQFPTEPQIAPPKAVNIIEPLKNKPKGLVNSKNSKSLSKEKKKIMILDEQKISEPVTVSYPVKLEPVCPSAILPLPNKRRNLRSRDISNQSSQPTNPDLLENTNNLSQAPSDEGEIINFMTVESIERIDDKTLPQKTNSKARKASVKVNHVNPEITSNSSNTSNIETLRKANNSMLKNKIPPKINKERMAVIEEKRKFNMKLRDIIASCLDKLDNDEPKDYESGKIKSRIERNIAQKVSSYLAADPDVPSFHDYTVAYLEARMKKMEDILLRKIDQNSQRIIELKQSLVPIANKKVAHTQTAVNEEVQKKNLYQEISKYLSPEANSLLYEELFINKHIKKNTQSTPNKRRKYRS